MKTLAKLKIKNKQFFIMQDKIRENSIVQVGYYFQDELKLRKVTNINEIEILDEVINKLNQLRYIYCGVITYEEQDYLWYINLYILQSFFAKNNGESIEVCKYENYKQLYEKYDLNPQIKFFGKEKNNFLQKLKPKAKNIKIVLTTGLTCIFLTTYGALILSQNNIQPTTEIPYEIQYNENIDSEEIKYGSDYNTLIDAIKQNNYITDKEKNYILQNFNEFFIQNCKYINENNIVQVLKNLKIEYKYEPNSSTLGEYYSNSNTVIIYNGNNLDESLKNGNVVLAHEIFHAIQKLGLSKIDEGFTELLAREYTNSTNIENSLTTSYSKRIIFAKMLCEVFSPEDILKDSLKSDEDIIPLVEDIMKKKKQDYDVTVKELSTLYDHINNSIRYLEEKTFSSFFINNDSNEQDVENYINDTFELLRNYDIELNGRDENKNLDIYEDMLMNTNKSKLLDENSNETIVSYDKKYFSDINTTNILKIQNSNGYIYEEKDNYGNIINIIKVHEKEITLDTDGNIIKEETPKDTYERLNLELQKNQRLTEER